MTTTTAKKWTRDERERLFTIIETALLAALALVALWLLDIDLDKIASISAPQWALIATGVGGVVVSMRNALRGSVRRPARVDRERTTDPGAREEGSATVGVLLWLTLAAGLALLLALPGCGTVLSTHARIATVAMVSIQGAQRAVELGHGAEIAACPDVACVHAADERWEPAGASLDGTIPALEAWVGTLEVAQLADGGAGLEETLRLAFERFAALWRGTRETLESVGVDLGELGGAL